MGLDLGLVAHKVVRSDGQGRAMLELARAAAGAGHAVTVYCHTIDPGLLRAGGIRWRRVAGSPGPDIVFGAAFAARATKALRRAGHELTCVLGSCAFGPVPFVNYAHFSWHAWRQAWNEVGGRPLHRRADAAVWERLERRCAGAAEAVMAVSGSLARDIEEVLCKPRRAHPAPSRILTVPNGIDLDEFRPATPDERQAARTRFGLSPDDTVVAFVGEFNTPRKGLRPLIEALARGRNPRERLLIAGDGPARRLPSLGGRVRYAGRVVPVTPVFHAADVVAVPSIYEPFSLVALEAAAAGVPLVLSARAGAAEHLASAAVMVDHPADPDALRRALDDLEEDPEAARRLAFQARRTAEGLHWRITAGRALEVLERVAGARAP